MRIESKCEQELIARWIRPNPHDPDIAAAWVLPRNVSAWLVIRQLQLDHGKAELVAEDYELPVEAVEAAESYYHRHQPDIDARIAANRAFWAT